MLSKIEKILLSLHFSVHCFSFTLYLHLINLSRKRGNIIPLATRACLAAWPSDSVASGVHANSTPQNPNEPQMFDQGMCPLTRVFCIHRTGPGNIEQKIDSKSPVSASVVHK